MIDTVRIRAERMTETFLSVLLKHDVKIDRAETIAEIFTMNSVDGVYSHGVNRFVTFIKLVERGLVIPNNDPQKIDGINSLEQWDGKLGAGVLNAVKATDRAMELASGNGLGLVALANTNHWMRGGYYGWHAAKKNFVFIGWTNTIANMPAWGATDARLGNNPLVIGVPFAGEAIVLDMAASQFSYGALELAAMRGTELPVNGGYNKSGELTKKPTEILETKRTLPAGYWKGAGLSLLLDILSAILSGGLSTHEITARRIEYGLSQVFVAIDLAQLKNFKGIEGCIDQIIQDYKGSVLEKGSEIVFPGERVLKDRKTNLANGIPVLKKVWQEIETLL
ncbi:MAG: 3-dehydro-L-gulonate 2-dehydrogenase [Flavisolibacter sp.]